MPAPFKYYYRKSVAWFLLNAAFGLLPLLFMKFVFLVSGNGVGAEEINHLIEDGVVQFVCCAITGAVLVDIGLSGEKVKVSKAYWWLVIPAFMVALLLTNYILIILKAQDRSCFNISSWSSICIIILTLFYCTFNKASLYMKEDSK
ncbi:MAG TPA: hypothetical protein VNS32_04950 [Flavisolibacter sp.]|nr:hypothetical protein [Flavisolibacter sp.]